MSTVGGMKVVEQGSTLGAVGAALTSAAASICCIGPAGIALLGVNGAIFAAGLKPYRGYLLGGSFLLLAFAFWSTYRVLDCERSCSVSRRGRKVLLWTAAAVWMMSVVIQFAADRYWL